MEIQKKFCSKHNETIANNYCRRCEIFMCKKCENLHSQLLTNHQIFTLDKNINEIFTGFCNVEKHQMELEFFCRKHNQLCCAACIAKIQKNSIGEHKDCDVCLIEEIKDEKLHKLKESIKYLETLSKNGDDSINKIKELFAKINKNKEELMIKIQKIFTNIRNEIP